MRVSVEEGVVVETAVRVEIAVFDLLSVCVPVVVIDPVVDAVTVGLMVWDAEDV